VFLAETAKTRDESATVRAVPKFAPALHLQHNLQNAVFCEEKLGNNHALNVYLTYKDVDHFRNGPRIIVLESLPNK